MGYLYENIVLMVWIYQLQQNDSNRGNYEVWNPPADPGY